MKRWEYKWDNCMYLDQNKLLKKRGEEGWELVSVILDNHNTRFYWKKELTL
mgnify:CR=1 FL=1